MTVVRYRSLDGLSNIAVSATTPLPVTAPGAATEATLETLATEATLSDVLTELQTPAASLPPPAPVAASDTTFTFQPVASVSATTTDLVPGVASQFARIHKGLLVIGGAQTIQFKSGSTNLGGVMTFGAGGGVISFDDVVYPELKSQAAGEALTITTTTTATVSGWVWYVQSA